MGKTDPLFDLMVHHNLYELMMHLQFNLEKWENIPAFQDFCRYVYAELEQSHSQAKRYFSFIKQLKTHALKLKSLPQKLELLFVVEQALWLNQHLHKRFLDQLAQYTQQVIQEIELSMNQYANQWHLEQAQVDHMIIQLETLHHQPKTKRMACFLYDIVDQLHHLHAVLNDNRAPHLLRESLQKSLEELRNTYAYYYPKYQHILYRLWVFFSQKIQQCYRIFFKKSPVFNLHKLHLGLTELEKILLKTPQGCPKSKPIISCIKREEKLYTTLYDPVHHKNNLLIQRIYTKPIAGAWKKALKKKDYRYALQSYYQSILHQAFSRMEDPYTQQRLEEIACVPFVNAWSKILNLNSGHTIVMTYQKTAIYDHFQAEIMYLYLVEDMKKYMGKIYSPILISLLIEKFKSWNDNSTMLLLKTKYTEIVSCLKQSADNNCPYVCRAILEKLDQYLEDLSHASQKLELSLLIDTIQDFKTYIKDKFVEKISVYRDEVNQMPDNFYSRLPEFIACTTKIPDNSETACFLYAVILQLQSNNAPFIEPIMAKKNVNPRLLAQTQALIKKSNTPYDHPQFFFKMIFKTPSYSSLNLHLSQSA